VDLKEIKSIIDLMKKNSLSEFELEEKDFKIKLKRPIGGSGPMLGGPVDDPELTAYSALARQSAASVPTAPAQSSIPSGPESEIKSPMINTPSPDAAPYVEIGSEVGPDTVVCILEAMKVMNEIKAETRGIITAMVAENGKPVEFGQVLFKIRPL
jgi:acetyl-CoA carboxylase biotin carboxyl carrier protein